jgi:hypothetical protein
MKNRVWRMMLLMLLVGLLIIAISLLSRYFMPLESAEAAQDVSIESMDCDVEFVGATDGSSAAFSMLCTNKENENERGYFHAENGSHSQSFLSIALAAVANPELDLFVSYSPELENCPEDAKCGQIFILIVGPDLDAPV